MKWPLLLLLTSCVSSTGTGMVYDSRGGYLIIETSEGYVQYLDTSKGEIRYTPEAMFCLVCHNCK